MASIRSGIGLVSGINTSELIEAMITLQRTPIFRLEDRVSSLQSTQTALRALEASLLSVTTSVQQLGLESVFNSFSVANSDSNQIDVTTTDDAIAGTHQIQAIRKASTHALLSKGFVNADQQSIGTGTLTIATGGQLHQPTLVDALNGGNGIRRGTVRITDRSGTSADIDLTEAHTIDDVLAAINNNADIAVTATTDGGNFVITDTSGATTTNLSIVDLGGGHAAEDLGIDQSVAADSFDGDTVFEITGDFTLESINDGNAIQLLKGAPDVKITLTDDTEIEVQLDDAVTINDVLAAINDHEDNGGKVSAALVDGALELTDLSGGGGSSAFTVEDINGSTVVRQLGIDVTASGGTISGRRLSAGMNSVLLANLRGGQGIDQTGQISLTDRAGVSATIDLSGAESLDEVLNAINAAENGGTKLQLTARVNDIGTGILIEDTSGQTASNLIVADVGGSTLAAQLGIEVNAAQNSTDSGRLDFRYVNQATSIENYAPDGNGIDPGSIRIIDSAGNEAVIEISSAVKDIGDVLERINVAAGVSVTAQLNDTGDGFVLIDEAGGSETLRVEEVGGSTAGDLRLLGDSVLGGDGKYRIDSRFAAVIDVEADDTLNDIVAKINDTVGFVTASVTDDGSAFNSARLSLVSTASGAAGQLVVDDGGLGLSLNTVSAAEDALLRVGASAELAFLIASETSTFSGVSGGLDIDVLEPGDKPAEVTVSKDTATIEDTVQNFVDNYNNFVDTVADLTSFDTENNTRAVLQGSSLVLRTQRRLDSFLSRQYSDAGESFDSLVDLGVRVGTGGKLVFDKDRLADALADDPQGVTDFFIQEETGFADLAQATIDSLTDPFTGSFTLENNALQDSVDSLTARIEQLEEILDVRRDRLVREFVNMENALSALATQQQAITGLGGF